MKKRQFAPRLRLELEQQKSTAVMLHTAVRDLTEAEKERLCRKFGKSVATAPLGN
ncbi:MAG: hypothetical protein J6127_04015 [Clostridiales bacterium]|nr:hypothetical protein [Clostridiales bacterium]